MSLTKLRMVSGPMQAVEADSMMNGVRRRSLMKVVALMTSGVIPAAVAQMMNGATKAEVAGVAMKMSSHLRRNHSSKVGLFRKTMMAGETHLG